MRPPILILIPILLPALIAACTRAAASPAAPATPVLVRVEDVPDLALAFTDGARLATPDVDWDVTVIDAGTLSLPSGAVAVTDPFTFPDGQALAQRLPPGSYPVRLSLLREPDVAYGVIAAAMLQVSPQPPVDWYWAHTPEGDPRRLKPGEMLGYPVDSGTAAFISPEAGARLQQNFARLGAPNLDYIRDVSALMEANAAASASWVNLVLDPSTGLNAVLFQAGYGDGFYAAYWGYDAAGQLACLVTEFGLLP